MNDLTFIVLLIGGVMAGWGFCGLLMNLKIERLKTKLKLSEELNKQHEKCLQDIINEK